MLIAGYNVTSRTVPQKSVFAWRGVNVHCLCLISILLLPSTAAAQALVVFSAASLTDAVDTLAADFQRANGEKVVTSYASSSTLARQIEQGAPAHVFLSASLEWMDYLDQRGELQPDSRFNLLSNELVLIAPRASTVDLTIAPGFPLVEALGDGRLAMGDPDHVPAGIYGRAALEKLGVWSAVTPHIARADSVRAALALVSRGEAPLGIVYRSDTVVDPEIRIIATFPPGSHPPIVYPAALIAENTHPSAEEWLNFLRSDAARRVFERYGFDVIR